MAIFDSIRAGKQTIRMHIRNIRFLCLPFLVGLPVSAISDLESFDKVNIVINGAEYNLEIAKTQAQRSQGLMYRRHVAGKEGMLFIYTGPGDHRIWMRNTLIPLTVIWLDENESVIAVKQLQPCNANFCPGYGVSRFSKYIIELKAGSHGIKPRDRITGLKLLE
jgi:hypothetical protein